MLEVLQQMRLAGPEITRDQHAPARLRHRAIGSAVCRLVQQLLESLLGVRLRTAQDAHRFPIGYPVAQRFYGPAAGESVRYVHYANR